MASGEGIVRGANVFDGYDHSASAIESAFSGEWYRTGDVGFFDEDGYLTLVGRTKEMINRGGQRSRPSRWTKRFLPIRKFPMRRHLPSRIRRWARSLARRSLSRRIRT